MWIGVALDIWVNFGRFDVFVILRHSYMKSLSVHSQWPLPESLFESRMYHREAWHISAPQTPGRSQFCYGYGWCLVCCIFSLVIAGMERRYSVSPTFVSLTDLPGFIYLLFENFVGKVDVTVANIVNVLQRSASESVFILPSHLNNNDTLESPLCKVIHPLCFPNVTFSPCTQCCPWEERCDSHPVRQSVGYSRTV